MKIAYTEITLPGMRNQEYSLTCDHCGIEIGLKALPNYEKHLYYCEMCYPTFKAIPYDYRTPKEENKRSRVYYQRDLANLLDKIAKVVAESQIGFIELRKKS